MFKLFANITPIYFLYLLYGASFLFLGVSIAVKNMKGSDLKLGDSLWLLAAFGFSHGANGWLELGTWIEGGHLSFQQIFGSVVKWRPGIMRSIYEHYASLSLLPYIIFF